MTPINSEIQVKNLDHLGLIAGIIDELGIVEIINEQVGIQPSEIVSTGVVVKAIILKTNIFLLIALAADQLGKLTERPTLRWIFQ